MTRLMEKALAMVRSWPDAQQDEAAEILPALDRLGPAAYQATDDELHAIDAALAQIERASSRPLPTSGPPSRASASEGPLQPARHS